MSEPRDHERYEVLLMKAVDGLLSTDEQRELDEHLQGCASCRDELGDFHRIKETTDAMTARILQDVHIEPPRPSKAAKGLINASFLALLLGTLLLCGYAGTIFFTDAQVPLIIKVGAAAAGAGALGLFGYVLRARLRAMGRDPYEEIDR